ncbi:alpha kinase/elongation factor 2 kinase [Anaeramoeba flamelloides]|uniref:Alpha kinase/elongation factor 2 kinase n=1 Tax=Anaeramoeba flamelloides TaxID=1746091 RepID=A0AAV7Z1X8_9EUKA|nr:alpha kinase/elongation factor 2 kinase [Anaeramoeba flamelloides]
MENKNYVVAIDFGTSQSGYAYSFIGDKTQEVYGMESSVFKIDSTILLLRDKGGLKKDLSEGINLVKCIAFGSEAVEIYKNAYEIYLEENDLSGTQSSKEDSEEDSEEGFESESEEESGEEVECDLDKSLDYVEKENKNKDNEEETSYNYEKLEIFQFYKMRLYGDKKTVASQKGNLFLVQTVISFALRYVARLAMKQIGQKSPKNFSYKNIFWVLTVPAIWKDKSKAVMRKCAKKARIIETKDSKDLVLIREPEAAALDYFFSNKINNFEDKKGKILLFDAGSGTIDITVLQVKGKENQEQLKIIIPAKGSPDGSSTIDREFRKFILNFTQQPKDSTKFPVDFLTSFQEWIEIKHRVNPSWENNTSRTNLKSISIEASWYSKKTLKELMRDWNIGKNRSDIDYIHRSSTQPNSKIRLTQGFIYHFFEEPMLRIKECVENNFTKFPEETKGIHSIIMVGGFSNSNVLFKMMEDNFSNQPYQKKIILQERPERSVLFGAVKYGLMGTKRRKNLFTSRPLAYSYGINWYANFDATKHKKEKMEIIGGRELCKDVYKPLIYKNKPIKIGKKIKPETYQSMANDLEIEIYQTNKVLDPKKIYYVDDPIFHKYGSTTIYNINPNSKQKETKINIHFIFGGEMIEFHATNEETQEKFPVKMKYQQNIDNQKKENEKEEKNEK